VTVRADYRLLRELGTIEDIGCCVEVQVMTVHVYAETASS
jgi:hypothetical protein